MKCEEIRCLLWEYLHSELPPESRLAFDEHFAGCPECSAELKTVKNIKYSLSVPTGFDVGLASATVLSKVYDEIEDENKDQSAPHGFFRFKPIIGAITTAAVIILMIFTMWPTKTSAISVNTFLDEHITCVKEGQFKDYECHTKTEFSKKALNELGVLIAPLNTKHYTFISGDVRKIKHLLVAHALFKVNESMVSHFHIHDLGANLLKNRGVIRVDNKIWRFSSKGHEMIIIKESKGNYLIYTGKLPFKRLVKFYSTLHN